MTSPTGPDRDRLRASDAGQRTPPPVPYDQHEREMLELIGQRDRLEDIADRLAAAIAPAEVLGEHSSDNNPWRNALDYADTATQRRDAAPQQPPAQEREVGSRAQLRPHERLGTASPHTHSRDHAGVCIYYNCGDTEPPTPPSEADSAGEDGLRERVEILARVMGSDLMRGERVAAEDVAVQLRSDLAASSGVRGGDDQARERLADVLADNVAFSWGLAVGIDRAKWPEFWAEVADIAVTTLRDAGGQP